MKLQTKKHILRGLLLCIGVIIVALSLFYLYNYLDNNHNNNESFVSFTENYQPYYKGEPNNTITNKLPALSSTQTYTLSGLQAITTNNKQIYALLQNNAGQSIISYYNTTSTPNAWKNLALATNSSATAANVINKLNPSITNPTFDKTIQCTTTSSLMLTANQNTLFYYNGGTNDMEHVDCLYYMTLNADGTIPNNGSATLNCLKLPILDPSRILPTTAGSTAPSMNFDKFKQIAANQKVVFGLGCSNGSNGNNNLYYCNLTNGTPPNNNANNWKTKQISKANYTINNICVNDNCIFVYYSNTINNNIQIYYSQITIDNSTGDLSLNLQLFGDSSSTSAPAYELSDSNKVINFNNITVNNDVFWSLDSLNNKLWWLALNNGIPTPGILNYNWKTYNLSYFDTTLGSSFSIISSITNIILYKNNLVIFGNSNNVIIPLYTSTTSGQTSTTSGQTSTTSGQTSTTSGKTSTTSGKTSTTSGQTSTTSGQTSTTSGQTSTTSGQTSTTSGQTSTTSGQTSTTSGQTSTTAYPSTTKYNHTHNHKHKHKHKHNDSLESLLGGFDLNNFFGNGDDSRNLYISPMNDPNLYNPTNANRVSKIDSAFFPIVRLN